MVDDAKEKIDVSPVNDPPEATADTIQVLEGDAFSLDISKLLANDFDVDSQELSLVSVSGTENGRVFIDGNSLTLEHDGSEWDLGGFECLVTDGKIESEGSVAIFVTSPKSISMTLIIGLSICGALLVLALAALVELRKIRTGTD